MALIPRQELRQGQTLVMTPQLQQAIKLLQLSNLELAVYVEQEIEKNPLLEYTEADDSDTPAEGSSDNGAAGETEEPEQAASASDSELALTQEVPLDIDYENVFGDDGAAGAPSAAMENYNGGSFGRGGTLGFDRPEFDLEQTLPSDVSRRDYLLRQLNLDIDDPVDRLIGTYLIDTLDEAGYVTGDLEHVARTMGCEVSRVEETLSLLKGFDPPGIFARDLSECLALQLEERDRLDPAMRCLLDNLDLLADGDLKRLMKLCRVDGEDMAQMIAEIRALDPKPGLAFNQEVVQTAVPDVFVHHSPGGGWRVELNSGNLPRVLVDRLYCATISGQAKTKEDKAYISEHLSSANWLVKSLDQRANTILRVATEIVRQQEGFFVYGVEYLRPLTLRDIAAAVEMHESTVSRVTTNKYMASPRGTFELKYFFTSAIASSDGRESHSAEAVRHRIKTLIDNETADTVLSDESITDVLSNAGIDIARRTVAKYREALRIPSSVRRRRLKKNQI